MPEDQPYCGAPPSPEQIWSQWNGDPVLLAGLAALALAMLAAVRHGAMRAMPAAGAWLVLVALFVSPLCSLTSALFSARVAHHLILIAICAPLIAFAAPGRGRASPGLLQATFLVQFVVVWAWHAPALYDLSLARHDIYWLMQASLLAASMAFWRAVLRAADPVSAGLALLGTATHMGLLGALLTFAATPLYAFHAQTTLPWGLDQLDDQRLGGLLMWVPATLPYLAALVWIAGRSLAGGRERSARWSG